MISHIDRCIGLVAVLTLVRAARRPHPFHPTTAILLTLLTGVLLWANLRNSGFSVLGVRQFCRAVEKPGHDFLIGCNDIRLEHDQ